jgi:ABC-type multidrug transport system ATPase subunit
VTDESTAIAPAIAARGLGREFGERTALAGIELEVPPGATLAVLGPNGSGKTTLLRILAALLRPSSGDISVLGCSLPSESWRLRGRVGYLGHEPMLYRDLTPRENLRLASRLNRIGRQTAEERIGELLGRAGIEGRADDRVAELSAGMAQRVSLCQSVLHEPELLLLDEPDSHLDDAGRELASSLIGPADGRTRVLVTHDRDRALADADMALEL